MILNREIYEKNREGVTELFIEFMLETEEYGIIPVGHWLTPLELAGYPDNLDDIVATLTPKAIQRKIDEIAAEQEIENNVQDIIDEFEEL